MFSASITTAQPPIYFRSTTYVLPWFYKQLDNRKSPIMMGTSVHRKPRQSIPPPSSNPQTTGTFNHADSPQYMLELQGLNRLDARDDEDDWPLLALTDVSVRLCDTSRSSTAQDGPLVDILDVAEMGPFRVTGKLKRTKAAKKVQRLPTVYFHTIVIPKVYTYSIEQVPSPQGSLGEGSLKIWVLGQAGWYSVVPAAEYADIFEKGMAKARLWTWLENWHPDNLTQQSSPKSKAAGVRASTSMESLIREYFKENQSATCKDIAAATQLFQQCRRFLMVRLVESDLEWTPTPIWKYFMAKHKDEMDDVQASLARQRAAHIDNPRDNPRGFDINNDAIEIFDITGEAQDQHSKAKRKRPTKNPSPELVNIDAPSNQQSVTEQILSQEMNVPLIDFSSCSAGSTTIPHGCQVDQLPTVYGLPPTNTGIQCAEQSQNRKTTISTTAAQESSSKHSPSPTIAGGAGFPANIGPLKLQQLSMRSLSLRSHRSTQSVSSTSRNSPISEQDHKTNNPSSIPLTSPDTASPLTADRAHAIHDPDSSDADPRSQKRRRVFKWPSLRPAQSRPPLTYQGLLSFTPAGISGYWKCPYCPLQLELQDPSLSSARLAMGHHYEEHAALIGNDIEEEGPANYRNLDIDDLVAKIEEMAEEWTEADNRSRRIGSCLQL